MSKKRITALRTFLGVLLIGITFLAVSQEIQTDDYWQDLFNTDCCGWTGGDGVYSIPLKDGRSVFIFGDTYLGKVEEDNSRVNTSPAVKNSLVIYDDEKIETLYDNSSEKPDAYFQSNEADSSWFWPVHGFEYEDNVYFFLSEFRASGSGVFGFEWIGTSLAQIKTKDLESVSPTITKWEHNTDIHFGNAVLIEGKHLYVFGVKAFQAYVARTQLGTFDWEFLSKGAWVEDASKCSALEGLYVSEQFSIFKIESRFAILTQGAMLGKEIFAYTSNDIIRNWSSPIELFVTPEPSQDSTLISYNALAHPQFISENKLLISYCVNSTDFLSIYKDVNRYRPRFIRIPLELIKTEP